MEEMRTVLISKIKANKETTINKTSAGIRYPQMGTE